MEPSADPFETRLEALFADPPAAPDEDAFALALEQRLAQDARSRRRVYGACTAGAGLGAAAVFMLTGAFRGSGRALSSAAASAQAVDLSWVMQAAPVVGIGFAIWMIAEIAAPQGR